MPKLQSNQIKLNQTSRIVLRPFYSDCTRSKFWTGFTICTYSKNSKEFSLCPNSDFPILISLQLNFVQINFKL